MSNKRFFIFPIVTIIIAVLSINIPVSVHAKTFYTWIDKKGQTHITDYPPPEGEATKVETYDDNKRKKPVESMQDKIKEFIDPRRMKAGDVDLPSELKQLEDINPEALLQLSQGEFPLKLSGPMETALNVFSTALSIVFFALSLLTNLMLALCIYIIAQRVGVSFAWMAWIPLLNIFPLFGAAGYRWHIGLLVILGPIVAIVPMYLVPDLMFIVTISVAISLLLFFINVWMRICVNLDSSKWLGLLIIVPFINLFLPPYLAFKKEPVIEGIRRWRPTIIMFIVWAMFVAVFAFASPFIITPKFSQSLKAEKRSAAILPPQTSSKESEHLHQK